MVGVLLALLVLIGPPGQLATYVGFAGAGLTVALKDFIVGFIGWFVLMGKNGIRLGDWVEINEVSGEVVELGPFHTVLLETGNWAESGHPTGRRVTFSNSFAIEGHYFNFSTAGQWLWDELQVVLPTGEDLPVTEREKTISYWTALIRSSAIKNGHNPDVGEAFINKDKEVKIGDRVIHPKGTVLTLNAQEATEKFNGKPLLADGIAESIIDLMQKAGLKANSVSLDPTGFEQLAFWITALAPLLLLGGIIGAYLEFKIPGASLPGIISAICFALFFLGHYFAGLAGWEVVGLFVLGMALVIIEILFFAHSTIVFGVVGVFLILASLLWAMIDRYPGETFLPTGRMLAMPLLNLFLAIAAAAIVIVLLARYLPRTSIYRRFALITSNPPGPSLAGAPREFATTLALSPGQGAIRRSHCRCYHAGRICCAEYGDHNRSNRRDACNRESERFVMFGIHHFGLFLGAGILAQSYLGRET